MEKLRIEKLKVVKIIKKLLKTLVAETIRNL